MPPVQEEMSLLQSRSLSHSPAFSKCVDGDAYDDADASVEMPSTAEECKELLDRSKHQSFPTFMNNSGRNFNNNNNNGDINNNNEEEDEDDCWNLTSLEWLQDKNLLRKVIGDPYSGGKLGVGFLSTSPTPSEEGRSMRCNGSNCQFVTPKVECTSDVEGDFEPLMPSAYHPTRHADCKPPYSFSCLIFMAIENSPDKRLPVKDIYAWIQDNFPFFGRAPSGWKNSVRHNLSLNKCFTKVEKDKGSIIGKGSYWCVDPTYKANLLQALRKTPYQPFHQMQMVSSNHVAAPFGIPLAAEGRDASPNANIKSLFPYTSRKQQNKQNVSAAAAATDSSEIDVANALVSLKKSGGNWNVAGRYRVDSVGECSDDDDDEWVDEVVDDDDEEEEEEDEEMVTAQLVQMLKRKIGEQRLKELSCTPAATSDHQYGMSDDRVRDILTRYDCFDEIESCSVSEDDDECDEDDDVGKNGIDGRGATGESYGLLSGERIEEVEIKQEIKEEVISGDEGVSTFPAFSVNFVRKAATTLNKSGARFGRKKKGRASLPEPSVEKTPAMTRTLTGQGRKRKRLLEEEEYDDGSRFDEGHDRVPATRKQSKSKSGAKRRKEVYEEEEEEQRIREGADALLELATVMAAGEQMVVENVSQKTSDQESSSDSFSIQKDVPIATKKLGRRGRPPNPKNTKRKHSELAINSRNTDAVNISSRKIDYDHSGKKRLPRDFVPNGLTSVGSGPRLFQSKRLQMKYLEQAVSSHDDDSLNRQVKASKSRHPSKRGGCTRSGVSSVGGQQSEGLEDVDSKDWSINFSSVDLSEIGSSEPGKGEVLYDLEGKKMVVIGQVKKEPREEVEGEVKVKTEVEEMDHVRP